MLPVITGQCNASKENTGPINDPSTRSNFDRVMKIRDLDWTQGEYKVRRNGYWCKFCNAMGVPLHLSLEEEEERNENTGQKYY